MKTSKQHLGLHKVQTNAPTSIAGHTMDPDWFIDSNPMASFLFDDFDSLTLKITFHF